MDLRLEEYLDFTGLHWRVHGFSRDRSVDIEDLHFEWGWEHSSTEMAFMLFVFDQDLVFESECDLEGVFSEYRARTWQRWLKCI
jgi:hypothetical protein